MQPRLFEDLKTYKLLEWLWGQAGHSAKLSQVRLEGYEMALKQVRKVGFVTGGVVHDNKDPDIQLVVVSEDFDENRAFWSKVWLDTQRMDGGALAKTIVAVLSEYGSVSDLTTILQPVGDRLGCKITKNTIEVVISGLIRAGRVQKRNTSDRGFQVEYRASQQNRIAA